MSAVLRSGVVGGVRSVVVQPATMPPHSKAVAKAPAGSTIAIGTEIHLVNRLAAETPDKTVVSLDPLVCPCSTMFRIDAPHLAWILENLVEDRVLNQIVVDPDTTEWARVALQRMLDITQGNPVEGVRDPATDTRPVTV